jgi:hypothetical protein
VSLPCEWALPAPPAGETLDPTLVNVNVVDVATTPMVYVPSFAECPLAAGPAWYYDDALAPTKILVCPATCDLLTAQTTARLRVCVAARVRSPALSAGRWRCLYSTVSVPLG